MPNNELDDEVDPLTDDDVVDAADEDDGFEDDDEDDDEDDVEDGDLEARSSLTHEVGSEGGSPGEDMEIFRGAGGSTRGSEASETMIAGTRRTTIERRDDDDVLIERAP